ncbi:MAG: methyl-accepting chemotaxis protein, partial [Bacteroidota bacterium]
MKYFINLSTRTKLFFSFGLIWLMFLVGIIIAYNGLQQTIQSEKELHDLHFKIALDLRSLRSHQNFNRAAILDMMLIKNDAEQTAIENTINERTQTINDILLNLSKINMEQQFQGKIKELKDNIRVYQEERKKEITLVKEGKIEAALKIGTSSQKVLFEKIRTIETELGDKAEKDADEQLVSDSQNADFVILLFVIFGIVTLVFSLIIILIMNRTIASPLNEMAVIASRIASGDLSMELSKKERKDEVGSLNLAFSKMIEKLRNSIKDIIEGVNLL